MNLQFLGVAVRLLVFVQIAIVVAFFYEGIYLWDGESFWSETNYILLWMLPTQVAIVWLYAKRENISQKIADAAALRSGDPAESGAKPLFILLRPFASTNRLLPSEKLYWTEQLVEGARSYLFGVGMFDGTDLEKRIYTAISDEYAPARVDISVDRASNSRDPAVLKWHESQGFGRLTTSEEDWRIGVRKLLHQAKGTTSMPLAYWSSQTSSSS